VTIAGGPPEVIASASPHLAAVRDERKGLAAGYGDVSARRSWVTLASRARPIV